MNLLFLRLLCAYAECQCVHGSCRNGYCTCDPGWAGDDCSFFLASDDNLLDNCPADCSGHGSCVGGTCECDKGWTHSTCSVAVACAEDCNSPAGRCVQGVCLCEGEFTGPTCAEKQCPYDCYGHGNCTRGRCTCRAEYTGVACDVLASRCDLLCVNGGRCVDSTCLCPQGWTGGDCSKPLIFAAPSQDRIRTRLQIEQVGLDSLRRALAMETKARILQLGGVADASIRAPNNPNPTAPRVSTLRFSTDLGALPSEPASQNTHSDAIRSADTKFAKTEKSIDNAIETATKLEVLAREEEATGAKMRDAAIHAHATQSPTPTSRPPHVRLRGNANAATEIPPSDTVQLAGSVQTVPVACSLDNCVHGRCDVSGRCVCAEQYTGTMCATKRCHLDCNQLGVCVNEVCVCDDAHFGDACQHRRCLDDCSGNGSCADGVCECRGVFMGNNCAEVALPTAQVPVPSAERENEAIAARALHTIRRLPKVCPENCNRQGSCRDGVCLCSSGFSGAACQNYCPNACSRRGECIQGGCLCFSGFLGADCSIKVCCNGHGSCDDPGTCSCYLGWSGEQCEAPLMCPDPNCSGHGNCINGRCECFPWFHGPACAQSVGACFPACKADCMCNEALSACECPNV